MEYERLEQADGLRRGSVGSLPVFLHDDHRWTVPLIGLAQREALVPTPCDLYVFDRHHDSLPPRCTDTIRRIRADGVSVDRLLDLCVEGLSRNDDDWIKAAMELGLVRHAVVFGVEGLLPRPEELDFVDHAGDRHRILPTALPGDALEFKGRLSDRSRRHELAELWSILGWEADAEGFRFSSIRKSFLTIDLDCFVIAWRGYQIPWPQEVYEREFTKTPGYGPTSAWTGERFLRGLLQGAGVLDIAREPECCGGSQKSDQVLSDLNRILFRGEIDIRT